MDSQSEGWISKLDFMYKILDGILKKSLQYVSYFGVKRFQENGVKCLSTFSFVFIFIRKQIFTDKQKWQVLLSIMETHVIKFVYYVSVFSKEYRKKWPSLKTKLTLRSDLFAAAPNLVPSPKEGLNIFVYQQRYTNT